MDADSGRPSQLHNAVTTRPTKEPSTNVTYIIVKMPFYFRIPTNSKTNLTTLLRYKRLQSGTINVFFTFGCNFYWLMRH